MTEPTALTIRHMKIEDYPLAYVSMGGAACCGFYSLSANNVG